MGTSWGVSLHAVLSPEACLTIMDARAGGRAGCPGWAARTRLGKGKVNPFRRTTRARGCVLMLYNILYCISYCYAW
jgi:hypothetical protein